MSRGAFRLVGLALIAIVGSGGLFVTCFERHRVEVHAGASREARANPFLALGRFLERMGHELRWLEGPSALEILPPSDATLVLTTPRRTLTERRTAELLDWVADGGHLVAATYSLWDDPERERDPLLDRFGLQQYQHVVPEDEELEDLSGVPAGVPDEAPAPAPIQVGPGTGRWDVTHARGADPERPLRVGFVPDWYWVDAWYSGEWKLSGDAGTHLIVVPVGEGRITALTDDYFLRNEDLAALDHAEFALGLARLGEREGPVWIVISEEWPGLWSLTWRHARPALIGVGILLTAWVWRASRRFGPLRSSPQPARRSWMEHLDAVGRFHWRQDRGRALLDGSRLRALRTLRRTRPSWDELPSSARADKLAEAFELSAAEVSLALDGRPEREEAFVRAVATLERIQSSR